MSAERPDQVIRVALVDDQEIVRRGIGMVLGLEADIEVVAEADDGRAASSLAARDDIDVVLMELGQDAGDVGLHRRLAD
ncbi:MAG: hypothetical protein AAFO29_27190, partial [Actinomycetota bacterium]